MAGIGKLRALRPSLRRRLYALVWIIVITVVAASGPKKSIQGRGFKSRNLIHKLLSFRGGFGSNPFGGFGSNMNDNRFGTSGNFAGTSNVFGQQSPSGQQSTFGGFGGTSSYGQTSTFGSAPSTTGGSGLFGQQSTQQSTGGMFGSSNQNSFSFATKPPSPIFGQTTGTSWMSSPAPTPFGSSIFGSSSYQSMGSSQGGTGNIPWKPITTTDITKDRGYSNVRSLSITTMPEYQTKSFEELRWEDYQQGRSPRTQSQQSPFQNQNQVSTPFGQQQQQQSSQFASTFGSSVNSKPSFGLWGASTPPPTPFQFSSPQNQQPFGMNSNTAGAASPFGGFGQTTRPPSSFFGSSQSSIFGGTGNTMNQGSVNLFGGTSAFTQNPQQSSPGMTGGSSIFGGSKPSTSFTFSPPTPATTSLFGGSTTQQSYGSSLFGQKPASSFAFSGTNTTFGTSPPSPFMFSVPTTQPTISGFGSPGGSSVFGGFGMNSMGQQQSPFSKPTSSLFGGVSQPQQQQGVSLFGKSAFTNPPSSVFGTSNRQQPGMGFGQGFGTASPPGFSSGFGAPQMQNQGLSFGNTQAFNQAQQLQRGVSQIYPSPHLIKSLVPHNEQLSSSASYAERLQRAIYAGQGDEYSDGYNNRESPSSAARIAKQLAPLYRFSSQPLNPAKADRDIRAGIQQILQGFENEQKTRSYKQTHPRGVNLTSKRSNNKFAWFSTTDDELRQIYKDSEQHISNEESKAALAIRNDPFYRKIMDQHRQQYNRLFGVDPAEPLLFNHTLRTAQDIARANLDPLGPGGAYGRLVEDAKDRVEGLEDYQSIVEKISNSSRPHIRQRVMNSKAPRSASPSQSAEMSWFFPSRYARSKAVTDIQCNSPRAISPSPPLPTSPTRRMAENSMQSGPGSQFSSTPAKSRKHLIPKLDTSHYYMRPSAHQMATSLQNDPNFLMHVTNFTVGHHLYGVVQFEGRTDVRGLDIKDIIQFRNGTLEVYSGRTPPPEVGKGLNKPAIVTLNGVSAGNEDVSKFCAYLQKLTEDQGAEFLGYDHKQGTWKMRVTHF